MLGLVKFCKLLIAAVAAGFGGWTRREGVEEEVLAEVDKLPPEMQRWAWWLFIYDLALLDKAIILVRHIASSPEWFNPDWRGRWPDEFSRDYHQYTTILTLEIYRLAKDAGMTQIGDMRIDDKTERELTATCEAIERSFSRETDCHEGPPMSGWGGIAHFRGDIY